MDCVLFEDQFVEDCWPATVARPAFAVTCGVASLFETVRGLGARAGLVMRDYLEPVFRRRLAPDEPRGGPTLYLNAALVPDSQAIAALLRQAADGEPFLIPHERRVAAALLADGPLAAAQSAPEAITAALLERKLPLREEPLPTLDYAFHVVRYHMEIFRREVARVAARGGHREIRKGVYAADDVEIAPSAVLHAEDGPIVLDEGVRILDFAYLVGPLYIGRKSRVIERSSVKEGTSIGHTCKIGGEVEESVIEDYTNKQHHGFLGHSYVGSWVNMGAGTSNSDLKNTYGMIRVEAAGRRLDTGMQFLGCAIGDFAKTAINTSIFTGKMVGAASMVYGFVTTNVPSFCNYARSFGQVTEVAWETAADMQKRMYARRQVAQTPEDVDLMRAMYERTRPERAMATEPLSL